MTLNNKKMPIKTDRIKLIEREIILMGIRISEIDKKLDSWIQFYRNHLDREHRK